MPKTNMTKKEICEAKAIDLALRMEALFTSTEDSVEGVSLADAKEVVEIEAELKKRLLKALSQGKR